MQFDNDNTDVEHNIHVTDAMTPLLFLEFIYPENGDKCDIAIRVIFVHGAHVINAQVTGDFDQAGAFTAKHFKAATLQHIAINGGAIDPPEAPALAIVTCELIEEYVSLFNEGEAEDYDPLTLSDLSVDFASLPD